MTTYHIYFRNQFADGDGNYTLWRDTPQVYSAKHKHVHVMRNSFLAANKPLDSAWNIDINDVPYAFCGTSPSSDLQLGDQINDTAHKLAKIVPAGNGSTVAMYNNKGLPAFHPDVYYRAPPGTFEITTTSDFNENFHFVAGWSNMDSNAKGRPAATFKVEPSDEYYIKPNVRFYIANFASRPGSIINYYGISAEIDFDTKPGLSNAIVTHMADGSFDVKIVPEAVFAMETTKIESTTSAPRVQLTQLKQQAKLMSNLIDAALGISIADVGTGRFRCTAEWVGNPSLPIQTLIPILLREHMTDFGYEYVSTSLQPKLSMIFTHTPDIELRRVFANWVVSIYKLERLRENVTNPLVQRVPSGPTPASQPESIALPTEVSPWPKPQWRCSVHWLEGPPQGLRKSIAKLLTTSMKERGYIDMGNENTEEHFYVDFYHHEPTSHETTTADWLASYNKIEPFVKMWVGGPTVNALYHTQTAAQPQTNAVQANGAPASTSTVAPSTGRYLGMLEWLEGPNEQTKISITGQLTAFLQQRGYTIISEQDLTGLTRLMIVFSHDTPHSLADAQRDWRAAYDSIRGNQRMFITNPICGEDGVVKTPESPFHASYLGCLTWLEGPNKPTRDSIIAQIEASLVQHGNQVRRTMDMESILIINFVHQKPSSLEEAQRDWITAVRSVNEFQRMKIGRPFCEEDGKVRAYDTTAATTNGGAVQTQGINLPPQPPPLFSHQSATATTATDAAPAPVPQPNPTFDLVSTGFGTTTNTSEPVVGPAPVVQPSFSMQSNGGMSLEEKKRRALELLSREGLVGIQGLSVA